MATELACKVRGTRTSLGKEVRDLFMKATRRECEPLVCGDIEKGNKFIVMPIPGDNSGHGGLLNGSWLFLKTEEICHPISPTNCIRLCDGTHEFIRDEEFVIKVE